MFATYDSQCPEHGQLIPLRKAPIGDWVSMLDTEYDVIRYYDNVLKDSDVVHDFAHNGQVAKWCLENNVPFCNTLWGNSFLGNQLNKPSFERHNAVCWSQDHRQVGITGGNGYEGTPWHMKYPFAGKLAETTKVVLGGVDTDYYYDDEKVKREDFILFLARAHESKGVDLAIEIAKQCPTEKFKFSGSFSGALHGHDGKKYIDQINTLPNADFVNAESHDTKRKLYQTCKAYLFPVQYRESFGIVIAEAMACGTPCITSNRGSMPELMENGVTGFICDDVEHYINAINTIDSIDRHKVRKHCVDRFNMERVAKDYLKVYECAIKGEKW